MKTCPASQIRRLLQCPVPSHPLVFLFMGSSGIGKTELAKQTAEYMHSKQAGTWLCPSGIPAQCWRVIERVSGGGGI